MDMKRILQAVDNASTKPVEGANEMAKFMTIVTEGKGSLNRLTAAETIAVNHYTKEKRQDITSPVLNVREGATPSMIGKYFKQVEQEFVESAERSKDRAKQLAEVVAKKINEKTKSLKTSNPCWKGYHPVGTKQKNGRTVPNCVPSESVEESVESGRCPQCGSKNCSCPKGKCKCKPIKGWIPNKGFKKAVEEAANAAQQAAIAISMKKAGKKPKNK